jgi:hypothetical protein
MRKRTKGSFDRKRASEAAKARWAARESALVASSPIPDETPEEALRRLSRDDPANPRYVQMQAAAKRALLPIPESEQAWRNSPQVQPGYEIPSWAKTFLWAVKIGAVELCDDCAARFQKEADDA